MLNFGDIKIDDEKMVSMVKGIPQLIDTIQKLEKENEEITNKYNEGYDLIVKTKTNMEEMLDKIEKLEEENELLEKDNDLLEEENKQIKDELDYYKNFKSKFNDFIKGHNIASSWGKKYEP